MKIKILSAAAALVFIIFSPPLHAQNEGKLISPPKADPRCALRGERGPCKALIESWHYDPGSNSCKLFFWGGCGEPRPFSSERECLNVCAGNKK